MTRIAHPRADFTCSCKYIPVAASVEEACPSESHTLPALSADDYRGLTSYRATRARQMAEILDCAPDRYLILDQECWARLTQAGISHAECVRALDDLHGLGLATFETHQRRASELPCLVADASETCPSLPAEGPSPVEVA